MPRKGCRPKDRDADLLACSRMLGDANYQLGIVVGQLDEMGVKRGMRNILAAHAQINKARAALRSHAQPK